MDYFAIVSFDVADSSDGRKKAVDEHRARLEELDQAVFEVIVGRHDAQRTRFHSR